MAAKSGTLQDNLGQLEKVLEEYLVKKAPALPTNIKDILVKLAPYLAIVGVVLSVPALLSLFGLSAYLSAMPYAGYGMRGLGATYYLGILFLVVMVVLEALAIPGLFARSKKGWNMLYYSMLVNAIYSLVNFNLGGLIVGTLIGMYFLFQVKSYYK